MTLSVISTKSSHISLCVFLSKSIGKAPNLKYSSQSLELYFMQLVSILLVSNSDLTALSIFPVNIRFLKSSDRLNVFKSYFNLRCCVQFKGVIDFLRILLARSSFCSRWSADEPVNMTNILYDLSQMIFPVFAHFLSICDSSMNMKTFSFKVLKFSLNTSFKYISTISRMLHSTKSFKSSKDMYKIFLGGMFFSFIKYS